MRNDKKIGFFDQLWKGTSFSMKITRIGFCFVFSLIVCLLLGSCEYPMRVIGSIPDPQQSVTGFFDSVCKGDFKKADTYLGEVSIGMKEEPTDGFSKKLMQYLNDSYSYELAGKASTDKLTATQDVNFTYLDFMLLADDLRAKSSQIGKQYVSEQNEAYTELIDNATVLTDEGAELVAQEALDSIMKKNPQKYYATQTFHIEMKYQKKTWIIMIDNDLFEAISGKFSSRQTE